MDDDPARAERAVDIALLSPVVGGLVRTWTGTGTRLWNVDRPVELTGRLARGAPPRAPSGGGRRGIGGALQAEKGILRLAPLPGSTSTGLRKIAEMKFILTPAHEPAEVPETYWEEMFQFLAGVVDGAARYGEPVYVSPGGTAAAETHSCLVALFDRGDGPVALVDADPVPHGSRLWRGVPEDAGRAGITAPAVLDKVPGAALYVVDAVRSWGCAPWDVVVTFGRYRGTVRESADGLRYADLSGTSGAVVQRC